MDSKNSEAFKLYWEEDCFVQLCQAFRLFWDEDEQDASRSTLRKLMSMVGLEEVKAHFLKVQARVEIAKRQGVDLLTESFNVHFVGNPGTGEFA